MTREQIRSIIKSVLDLGGTYTHPYKVATKDWFEDYGIRTFEGHYRILWEDTNGMSDEDILDLYVDNVFTTKNIHWAFAFVKRTFSQDIGKLEVKVLESLVKEFKENNKGVYFNG